MELMTLMHSDLGKSKVNKKNMKKAEELFSQIHVTSVQEGGHELIMGKDQ